MYDALYAPLTGADAYFNRISYGQSVLCTTDWLDGLILAHQQQIPFENLDVVDAHRPVSLGIEDLFRKIVQKRRGGYCFELNGLFCALLQACGFEAASCMCRVVLGKAFVPPVLHRATIVTLKGRDYFADVGFGGPMPAGLMPIEDGAKRMIQGETFGITRADAWWWTLSRKNGDSWEAVLQFTLRPVDPVDFIALNAYCESSPDSLFTRVRLVNRRTAAGSVSISGSTLTRRSGSRKTEEQLDGRAALIRALAQEFGIPAESGPIKKALVQREQGREMELDRLYIVLQRLERL